MDHYSRRVMGYAIFPKEPKSHDIQRFLGSVVQKAGATPKYIVSDKGRQFDCKRFRGWCNRRGVQPRYASTGSLRATAVVERFIRSLKDEWLKRIPVPLSCESMRRELSLYAIWFETYRPHQGLDGRTPLEVYQGRRQKIPARAAVDRSRSISMLVHFLEGRKELPIVELRQAA